MNSSEVYGPTPFEVERSSLEVQMESAIRDYWDGETTFDFPNPDDPLRVKSVEFHIVTREQIDLESPHNYTLGDFQVVAGQTNAAALFPIAPLRDGRYLLAHWASQLTKRQEQHLQHLNASRPDEQYLYIRGYLRKERDLPWNYNPLRNQVTMDDDPIEFKFNSFKQRSN